LFEGILKTFDFVWCGSPQSESLSACISKHVKDYFGGFFGE